MLLEEVAISGQKYVQSLSRGNPAWLGSRHLSLSPSMAGGRLGQALWGTGALAW